MRLIPFLQAGALALGLIGGAWAQSAPEAAAAAEAAASAAVTAASASAPAAQPSFSPGPAATAATAMGGIQSANIFEIAPGAASDPDYGQQTNAERNRVQPGNNAPMWRAVGSGVTGYSSLPVSQAPEAGNLIQPMVQYPGSRFTTAGEAWRQVRNNWLIPYGGSLVLIALVALAILYFAKGSLGQARNDGPPVIERFTPFERSAHWLNAIAFVLLAVSGIVMAFGKFFLQPVLGPAPVRLAELPAQEHPQLRRPAVRRVAGDRAHHLPEGQHRQHLGSAVAEERRRHVRRQAGAFAPLQPG